MVQLLCTIWALVLKSLKISIFRTCFINATEDEYGEPLILSPSITSFLIATSVYVIVVSSTIFPQSFRKPKPVFMCLYEVSVSKKYIFIIFNISMLLLFLHFPLQFLVTAFFLEFAIACVWTPIDVFVLSTLPKNVYHVKLQSVNLF
jgi:hypothetical protein